MKEKYRNIANKLEFEKYRKQYSHIISDSYFQKTEIRELSSEYFAEVSVYNKTEKITHNYHKSITCHKAKTYDRENNLLYVHEDYFGKLFISIISYSQNSTLLFFTQDVAGYKLVEIETGNVYEYYPLSRTNKDDMEFPVDYWYVNEILFNPQNKWLAINGQDTMNCATTCLMNLSNIQNIPYQIVNTDIFFIEPVESYSSSAVKWNRDNSTVIEYGEEESHTVTVPEEKYISINDMLD